MLSKTSPLTTLCVWIAVLLLALASTIVALTRAEGQEPTASNNGKHTLLDYDDEAPPDYFQGLLPEDVRFARYRCHQYFPQANLNWKRQANMTKLVAQETHCYVKCFLRKLGLIHLRTLGWKIDRMLAIWRNLQNQSAIREYCYILIDRAQELSGKCVDYYNEWMVLHNECNTLFRYTFYEQVEVYRIAFKILPSPWRQRGENAIDFCTVHLKKSNSLALLTLCVYLQFHYFDGYGRLDLTEIMTSFAEAGLLTAHNAEQVKRCVHQANAVFFEGRTGPAMADELYNCFNLNMPKEYAIVHAHRDKVTRNL